MKNGKKGAPVKRGRTAKDDAALEDRLDNLINGKQGVSINTAGLRILLDAHNRYTISLVTLAHAYERVCMSYKKELMRKSGANAVLRMDFEYIANQALYEAGMPK